MNNESIKAVIHSIRMITYLSNYWISSIVKKDSAVFMSFCYLYKIDVQLQTC